MAWRGLPIIKNPCDLWAILELIAKLQPVAIVETGTAFGGSALFYADMAKSLKIGTRVITVDINPKWTIDPEENNITSVVGYSTNQRVANKVRRLVTDIVAKRRGHVLVILDSDHSMENVSQELQTYSDLVTLGSYLIVEDTNVNGHPSMKDHGPGPWEAVQAFLEKNHDFRVDYSRQRQLLTFNPGGYLQRCSEREDSI